MTCAHLNFAAQVNVHRLTDEQDVVTGYMSETRIWCTECLRQFQFLGLEAGVDTQGARMSIDGLEASIAIVPRGEVPSPLDRIAVNYNFAGSQRQ